MANQAMNASYKTTAPAIRKKSLHTPFSGPNDGVPEIIGILGRVHDKQQVAATATTTHVAGHPGKVRKLRLEVPVAPTTTETMTFDVQKNGVSILSATPQMTSAATTVGVYDVMGLVLAGTSFQVGDVITIIRTLANGAAITMTGVVLEWG